MKTLLSRFIKLLGIGNLPVKVPAGLNQGMTWTLFPWTSYWRGTHETSLQGAIRQVENWESKCCWDLGAHFGFYSVALSKLVGAEGQVFAFEPSADAFAKLLRHKNLNNLGQLKIFNGAVSDVSGTKELLCYQSSDSTTSHFAFEGETVDNVPFRSKVTTYALDELVAQEIIQLPDIIKIDVEGHGHMALRGAQKSIREARPIIFMGVHCIEEKAAVENLVLSPGYIAESENGNELVEIPEFGDIVLHPKHG